VSEKCEFVMCVNCGLLILNNWFGQTSQGYLMKTDVGNFWTTCVALSIGPSAILSQEKPVIGEGSLTSRRHDWPRGLTLDIVYLFNPDSEVLAPSLDGYQNGALTSALPI
jgi:hypothetical protein